MDDMVLLGDDKSRLHDVRKLMLDYLQENLHLWFKDNWQVFPFDYIADGRHKGRFIDFMGFRFYRTHTTMRRGITKKAMRKALKLSRKTYITIYDARQMLTYFGWIKHTDSHNFKLRHIDPYVDFTKLKSIISERSKVNLNK